QLKKIDKRITYRKSFKKIKSPGQKYKHYSPKAKVKIINNYPPAERAGKLQITNYSANIGLQKRKHLFVIPAKAGIQSQNLKLSKICRDLNEYAKNLFSFFRECD